MFLGWSPPAFVNARIDRMGRRETACGTGKRQQWINAFLTRSHRWLCGVACIHQHRCEEGRRRAHRADDRGPSSSSSSTLRCICWAIDQQTGHNLPPAHFRGQPCTNSINIDCGAELATSDVGSSRRSAGGLDASIEGGGDDETDDGMDVPSTTLPYPASP